MDWVWLFLVGGAILILAGNWVCRCESHPTDTPETVSSCLVELKDMFEDEPEYNRVCLLTDKVAEFVEEKDREIDMLKKLLEEEE